MKSHERRIVLVRSVRGIKYAGLCLSGMKSRERNVCPRPFGIMNQVGKTSSIRYDVVRKECMSSSGWYEESNRRDYFHPVRSRARRVCPRPSGTRYQASGFRLSDTESCEKRDCPCPSGTSKAGSSSVWYKVVRMEGMSSSI